MTEPTNNPHQAPTESATRKWKDMSFLVFLIWASVGLVITGLGIHAEDVEGWGLPAFLEEFGLSCLYFGDLIFMILAAVVVFQSLRPRLTLRHTFMAFLLISIVSGAVEAFGTVTGMPFGQYVYTENMGPRWFGLLPAAIPLAWWVVVAGFTCTIKQAIDRLPTDILSAEVRTSSGFIAVLVAAGATAFDWVMEPYAWKVMGYWIWMEGGVEASGVPWQNYASWFVLAYFLTRTSMLALIPARPADWRPTLVIALMLVQFILGRAVHLQGFFFP